LIPRQRTECHRLILDCNIRRFTDKETLEYFRLNGIEVSLASIKRYRKQVRENAHRWIARLAKSKRSDYIAEYKERIDELYTYQKELWKLYHDEKSKPFVKVAAMRALMESTKQLVEFYDALPIVTAIRDYPELPGASSFSITNGRGGRNNNQQDFT